MAIQEVLGRGTLSPLGSAGMKKLLSPSSSIRARSFVCSLAGRRQPVCGQHSLSALAPNSTTSLERRCALMSSPSGLGMNTLRRRGGDRKEQGGLGGHVSRNRPRPTTTCQTASAATAGSSFPQDVWVPPTDASFGEKLRAMFFYALTFVLAIPIFVVMLVTYPFQLLFDRRRRNALHFFNQIWATLTTNAFYKTEIVGWENLPKPDEPAVYVANHQSFLDIYTLFHLGRGFKFISKTSNFLIPLIGWSMYLTGHIPLKRMDKRSQMECLRVCQQLLQDGVPVLFFPEGTRTKDGFLADFKKGAFSIAAKAKVPVVPIALVGTGKLMPNGMESTLRPGKVKVVILPRVQGDDADAMCSETRKVIAQTLQSHGLGVH